MLNLLPPQQKKELLEEINWKIVLILITVATFFLVAFFLILLLINIIISSNLEIQKINFSQQEENPDDLQMKIIKKNLSDFNQTVSGLDDFYRDQMILSDTIEKISKLLLSSDLYLTDFNFTAQSAQHKEFSGEISLSGFATRRDSLLKFKEDLARIENFQEFNFPSSNWVKPADINFTVSFKIK